MIKVGDKVLIKKYDITTKVKKVYCMKTFKVEGFQELFDRDELEKVKEGLDENSVLWMGRRWEN